MKSKGKKKPWVYIYFLNEHVTDLSTSASLLLLLAVIFILVVSYT